MKTNLNIILVLTLITGACSSTTWLSEGTDDLYHTTEEGKCNDLIIAIDEGKVPDESPAVTNLEDEPLAYQEYNVSFHDTIWFDDYLVVGRDTFAYEQVYPQFAFEEYGVTPFDTIWFDNFLVIGADTLEYQQVYNTGSKYSLSFYSPGGFYWAERFNKGLVLSGVTPFYPLVHAGMLPSQLLAEGYGISWNYSAPLISPNQPWIEIVTEGSQETSRPNYTYYMGLPPQVSERDQAPAMRNDRERGVGFHLSVLSAILVFLSL